MTEVTITTTVSLWKQILDTCSNPDTVVQLLDRTYKFPVLKQEGEVDGCKITFKDFNPLTYESSQVQYEKQGEKYIMYTSISQWKTWTETNQ